MLRFHYNSRPERVIYRSLAASILVGSLLYVCFITAPALQWKEQIFLEMATLVLYYLGLVVGITLAFAPIWFLYGLAVYFIISWPVSSDIKKVCTAMAYAILIAAYRGIWSEAEEWRGNEELLLRLAELLFFITPAIVAIYRVQWLDVQPDKRIKVRYKFDDVLDE